ncbi:uncharacterized protein LOC116343481 [Contarinia nasturtii]|uniref:uncharacterized protein LOC116343481 n=1 Tax=Contarinia nasturtii TaxID=265458 RepID=UPI0012D440BA|nr:uncharacterized protein LOC116343481 [Contarinia nasturtii]
MRDLYEKLASKLKVVPSSLNTDTRRLNKYPEKYYKDHDRYCTPNQSGRATKMCIYRQTILVGKKYVIGINPNEKTWLAITRCNIPKTPDEPAVEENITIPNTRFYWGTRQKRREKEANKLAGWFDIEEKNHLKSYPFSPPSPRNSTWQWYIEYRIKMLRKGMSAYATRKYSRLDLDHYIKSNYVKYKIAVTVTNNMPSMIIFGASEMAPNQTFGVKKRKRCPGSRKFLVSVKKL